MHYPNLERVLNSKIGLPEANAQKLTNYSL
jgi:hypothetical protein